MTATPAAVSSDVREDASKVPRSGSARSDWLWATAIFCFLTVLTMWPALTHPNTVMGNLQPSDATAGGVRLGWLLTIYGPFAGTSRYLGAPQGLPFWPFTYYTSIAWILPEWFFAHLVGGVMSWNLATALGFVLDGLAMFGLVRWLFGRTWLAIGAGILYAFSPFHVEESYAHIGYVWTWIFPLEMWSALILFKRRTWRSAVVFGLLIGVGGYIDPYFLLFGPLLGLCFGFAALFTTAHIRAAWKRLLALYVVAGAVALAAILPLIGLYLTAPASSAWLVTNRTSLKTSRFIRGQPWEYVVPWSNSPLWGWLTRSWIHRQLGIVPPVETSLYLGTGVILLACAGVGWWIFSASGHAKPHVSEDTVSIAVVVPTFFLVAAVFIICSFAHIGPFPGFPIIVFSLLPLWRALSRLDVVADGAVIVIACVGYLYLVRSSLPRWILAAVAIAVVVDGVAILPWESWSYASNTPRPYTWLAHHPGGIVAEFPMLPPDLPAYIDYNAYQIVQQHPLFNGALPGSRHAEIERGVADLLDPQSIPVLREFGVEYVVLDHPLYDNWNQAIPWRQLHREGLRRIASGSGLSLFRIVAGRRAVAALTVRTGLGLEHPFFPAVNRWMEGSSATLGIARLGRYRGPLRVSFRARSYKLPSFSRLLTVVQRGRTLWRGQATYAGTTVSFVTYSSSPLTLHCRPGAVHVPGFLDTRSIDIIRLSVKPARGLTHRD